MATLGLQLWTLNSNFTRASPCWPVPQSFSPHRIYYVLLQWSLLINALKPQQYSEDPGTSFVFIIMRCALSPSPRAHFSYPSCKLHVTHSHPFVSSLNQHMNSLLHLHWGAQCHSTIPMNYVHRGIAWNGNGILVASCCKSTSSNTLTQTSTNPNKICQLLTCTFMIIIW